MRKEIHFYLIFSQQRFPTDMKLGIFYCLTAAVALLTFSSCHHNEPDPIKPIEERNILMVNGIGQMCDFSGEVISELPDCKAVSQIIVDGNDYFVAGSSTKDKVGYWKNGKWNTLHVDFVDDVDHRTFGIGKWEYYIYLLDLPNVLKNSGIFALRNSADFQAARHGISVSEGVCRVVGSDLSKEPVRARVPVIYNEYKGAYVSERLTLPDGVYEGEAMAVHAFDRDHVVVGGYVGKEPAIWIDGQLQILPRPHNVSNGSNGVPDGYVNAVTRVDGHICAAGVEFYDENNTVAIAWLDGVPQYLKANDDETFVSSEVVDIQTYGTDVYILTHEFDTVDKGDYVSEVLSSVLWMNNKVVGKVLYKGIVSFAVY